MLNDKYKDRSIIIYIVLAFFVTIFVGRLAQLQLFEDYSEAADDNAFYRKPIYAPRGLIYDRNGTALTVNQSVCTISVIHNQITDYEKVIDIYSSCFGDA